MWQILGIILGSGVVSALATHFLTTGLAEKNFRRGKLEQLYLAAHEYQKRLGERAVSSDRGKRNEQLSELVRTCRMITDMYFPELKPNLKAFEADYLVIRKMMEGGTEEGGLSTAIDAYFKSADRFIAAIVNTAQRMNRPWYRLKTSSPAE